MEHENLNTEENANSDLGAVVRSVVWEPTNQLRWYNISL